MSTQRANRERSSRPAAPCGGPAPAEPTWGVAPTPWDVRYGNHRARVQVAAPAPAVRAALPWRRHDRAPASKAVWVVSAATGERVHNVVAVAVTAERGDVVFAAPQAGEYAVYYLPFQLEGKWFPTTKYALPEDTADAAWRAAHGLDAAGLAAGAWQRLPAATLLGFEARTDWDRFDPMELPATAAETARLLAARPDAAGLLFAEDREHAIRMLDALPRHWLDRDAAAVFTGTARRHEFYVFQVALYAARAAVTNVAVEFADLHGPAGATLPATAFRCLNTGGTDWLGRPFTRPVRVPPGGVQPLWLGVAVPADAAPGVYEGAVTVRPAGQPPLTQRVRLTIVAESLADRGDAAPERLSRLRWLDSTIGLEPEVTRPYTPLVVAGATTRCLGRAVTWGAGGLPASITTSGGGELLAAPVRFVVAANGAPLTWQAGPVRVETQRADLVALTAEQQAAGARLACRATMEFDGYCRFALTLTAERALDLDDCRLEVTLREAFATYLMGLGCKGGRRPPTWAWRWDVRKYQDSLWLGDVDGGLHLKLKDPDYRRPLGNIHYHRQPLRLPAAWHNEGRGGCVVEPAAGGVVIRASGGPRHLAAGATLHFDFDLLITPVKPLDLRAHCQQRYFHSGQPEPADVAAQGANIINLHHANPLNPYINYPFLHAAGLAEYVRRAHARDLRVKLYYTIRELTNHLPELWALRSLGDEIYADGDGGGHAWLCEHLGTHYAPAWHHPFDDGTWCCSISQTGLSRWHNYYLEGLAWLCAHVGIDGLYLDEIGYDREIMKRVRRILDRTRPGALLDLHSWNHFNEAAGWANCLNLYLEHMPFLDSLWIGEGRDYDEGPDHWLVEASGIPFGLYSEMLEGGGNPWRGMLYAMTARMPWCGNPAALWRLWDDFGLGESAMLGYWRQDCPVRTDHERVLATVYRRPGRSLICLASWGKDAVTCRLAVDWAALGLDPARVVLRAPAIAGLQEARSVAPGEPLAVRPGGGWILLASEA